MNSLLWPPYCLFSVAEGFNKALYLSATTQVPRSHATEHLFNFLTGYLLAAVGLGHWKHRLLASSQLCLFSSLIVVEQVFPVVFSYLLSATSARFSCFYFVRSIVTLLPTKADNEALPSGSGCTNALILFTWLRLRYCLVTWLPNLGRFTLISWHMHKHELYFIKWKFWLCKHAFSPLYELLYNVNTPRGV